MYQNIAAEKWCFVINWLILRNTTENLFWNFILKFILFWNFILERHQIKCFTISQIKMIIALSWCSIDTVCYSATIKRSFSNFKPNRKAALNMP